MIDKASDYGYRYYDFMCRAFKTRGESSRQGIDRGLMMALVQTELENAIKPKPIEKQIENLQKHMGKALERMHACKLNELERIQLVHAQQQLQSAYSSDLVVSVIKMAMEATYKIKEQ